LGGYNIEKTTSEAIIEFVERNRKELDKYRYMDLTLKIHDGEVKLGEVPLILKMK
jgi:hypothetical protein